MAAGRGRPTLAKSSPIIQAYVFSLTMKHTQCRLHGGHILTTNGAGAIDFGSYDFTGKLSSTTRQSVATLSHKGVASGELPSSFFRPDGEEIGGPFTLMVQEGNPGAGTHIAGVTVAKRAQ